MDAHDPKQVALQFVAAINAHDVTALCALMPEGHCFIDSQGRMERGRETLRMGWPMYFQMFPDYVITIDEALADGGTVLLAGSAEGTYAPDGELRAELHWHIPAAWRAVIEDGLVAEWQVYADNSVVEGMMG